MLFKKIVERSYWALAIAVVIVAFVAIGAYAWNFRNLPISIDTNGLADFATYLSGTVGVAAVVATLIAFVITLRQQQRLIESQEEMLEKQVQQLEKLEEQLKLEKERTESVKQASLRSEKYVSIYLFHHFEILKGFYLAALEASVDNSSPQWDRLANESPDIYPKMLLEDNSDMLLLIEKLDSEMAVEFVKSVSIAKELSNIFKTAVLEVSGRLEAAVRSANNMMKVRNELMGYIEKRAYDGDKFCSRFLDKAKDKFDGYE